MTNDPKRMLAEIEQSARDGKLTRRGLLRRLVQAGTISAGMAILMNRTAAAQYRISGVRFVEGEQPVSSGRTDITANDIRFNGFHRFPAASSGNLNNVYAIADAKMCVAYSPERGTWFTIGATQPNTSVLSEMSLPSQAATLNPNTAPILTREASWGAYIQGDLKPTSNSSGWTVTGIFWDSNSQGIYTTYNVAYTLENSPSLVWTRLTGTAAQGVAGTAVAETYGGWRNNINGWTMHGGLIDVPQTWADDHLSGATMAFNGSRSQSGVGHSHGPSLTTSDLHTFDPLTAPHDTGGGTTPEGTVYSITSTRKLWFAGGDGHKMPIATTTKICGHPISPYICTLDPLEAPLAAAVQVFGTQDIRIGETDTIPIVLFVDTGDKWGIFNFASMPDTPTGYAATIVANGWDDDGVIHRGYADAINTRLQLADGSTTTWPDSTCCHGQVDDVWGTTGPFAVCREKFFYIYSPDTYASSIASGSLYYLENQAPDVTINLRTIMEAAMGTTIPYVSNGSFCNGFGGAFQVGRKIYVTIKKFENSRNDTGGTTGELKYRAVLAEFEIL